MYLLWLDCAEELTLTATLLARVASNAWPVKSHTNFGTKGAWN